MSVTFQIILAPSLLTALCDLQRFWKKKNMRHSFQCSYKFKKSNTPKHCHYKLFYFYWRQKKFVLFFFIYNYRWFCILFVSIIFIVNKSIRFFFYCEYFSKCRDGITRNVSIFNSSSNMEFSFFFWIWNFLEFRLHNVCVLIVK